MPIAKRKRTSKESGRFEARVSAERKSVWKKAAAICGNTLTEFVVSSADAVAERTIKEAEFMDLTQRDRVAFVQALLNAPAPPNEKLRNAAERYAQMFPAR
jgi:uncharacterized protein (DUF1778 family)